MDTTVGQIYNKGRIALTAEVVHIVLILSTAEEAWSLNKFIYVLAHESATNSKFRLPQKHAIASLYV